jgi:hypothetical protein
MKNCCKNCRLFSKCEDEFYWCPGDGTDVICDLCNPCPDFQEVAKKKDVED